jgi:hypothetical protein
VSIEALVLSLTAVVRPTSVAALLAILATMHPRRLLTVYLVVGLTFSVGLGAVVVVLLGGWGSGRSAPSRPVLDIVLGACSLAYSVGTAAGSRRHDEVEEPDGAGRPAGWMQHHLQNISLPAAALAGVLTHLPGLVYVAALNAIAGSGAGPAGLILQVVVYNTVWFSLPALALVLSIYRPNLCRRLLEQIALEMRRHRRTITVGFFGVLGVVLLATGIADLLREST